MSGPLDLGAIRAHWHVDIDPCRDCGGPDCEINTIRVLCDEVERVRAESPRTTAGCAIAHPHSPTVRCPGGDR